MVAIDPCGFFFQPAKTREPFANPFRSQAIQVQDVRLQISKEGQRPPALQEGSQGSKLKHVSFPHKENKIVKPTDHANPA